MRKIKFLGKLLYSKELEKIEKMQKEILYAIKCKSSFSECEWLRNKAFYPGGWAMGWPGLYILFRTLEMFKPTNIVELGLGETTRMLGQYAALSKDVNHVIVEHDINWIDFFDGNISNSKVINCELVNEKFRDKMVTRYKNFKETVVKECRFDLVVVDGPFGSAGYSRIDILDIVPYNLSRNFVIIIDDTNRKGERNTIEMIEQILRKESTPFLTGCYEGMVSTTVICSQELKFLCSLQ